MFRSLKAGKHRFGYSRLAFGHRSLPIVLALFIVPQYVRASTGLQQAPWPKFHGSALSAGLSGNYGATGIQSRAFIAKSPIFSSPAVALGSSLHSDGTIYFGDESGVLHAVDELTFAEKWKVQTQSAIYSSPAVASDGTVYVGTTDGHLIAVDGATGFVKWSNNLESGMAIVSSPAIDSSGNIYVATDALYKVSPTGVTLDSFGNGGPLSSVAIGTSGAFVIGSENGMVSEFMQNNALAWTFNTNGEVDSSPAIGPDGTVYIGSEDGNVYALNGSTGAQKWAFATSGQVESSPAVGPGGNIYVGADDGNVYGIDSANGTELWAFQTGDAVFSSPAIASDGTIYVGSDDSNLYALSSLGGEEWSVATQGEVDSSPAIGPNGSVYCGSEDGSLYGIQGQTIHNFFLTSNLVTGAQNFRGVIQVNSPAGSGGDLITLRSTTTFLNVPSTVTIPAGKTGVSFPISSTSSPAALTPSVTAIFGDSMTGVELTVHPYPISNFYASPSTVTGGTSTHGVIQLAGPASPSGNVITIIGGAGSQNLTFPPTVTVPPGKKGVSFVVGTQSVSSQTTTGLEAVYASTGGGTFLTITLTP